MGCRHLLIIRAAACGSAINQTERDPVPRWSRLRRCTVCHIYGVPTAALSCGEVDPADALDLRDEEEFYRRYLEACRRLGVEPVSRQHALGLVHAWAEMRSERPERTKH